MNDFNDNRPPSNIEYAVKVKTGAAWRKYSTCRLQISVGHDSHDGAKFEATIRWASRRFKEVILCVNDTLQRYNTLAIQECSDESVRSLWRAEGDAWLARNKHLFQLLPDYKIFRWDHWLNSSDYNVRREQVDMFYLQHEYFRSAIKENITSFWYRNRDRKNYESFEKFSNYSREYLLEETAVFSMMFDQKEAVDIYPGSVLLPATIFRNNPVSGMPQGLDKGVFTRIDFKRRQSSVSDNQTQAA